MYRSILSLLVFALLYIGCSEDDDTAPLPAEPIQVDYSGAYLGSRYVNFYDDNNGRLVDSSVYADTIFVFKHMVKNDSFYTWGYDNKYQESVNWGRLRDDGTFLSSGQWYDANQNDSFTQQHNHRIIGDTFHETIQTWATNKRWYGEGIFVKM